MKQYLLLVILLFYLHIGCKSTDNKNVYSFYDTSNYYIKNNRDNLVNRDSTYLGPSFFSIIDESEFLNYRDYNAYIILWSYSSFSDFNLILSIKALKEPSVNIVAINRINYNSGDLIPAKYLELYDKLMMCNFKMRKKSWKVDNLLMSSITDSLNNLLKNQLLNRGAIIKDGGSYILYFNGDRYYLISDLDYAANKYESVFNYIKNSFISQEDTMFEFVNTFNLKE